MATRTFVAGSTEPIILQIMESIVVDRTTRKLVDDGLTPSLFGTDKNDDPITFAGVVSWVDDVDGQVKFLPEPTDLDATLSPYLIRVKLVDVDGRIGFAPNGASPETWVVVP